MKVVDRKLRAKIVKEWSGSLPLEQKIVRLFERVRDIPFGCMGSRDPEDVYQKNMGTCSGKNLLLRELYNEIDIETKDMLTLHRFNDLVWFPTESYPLLQLPAEIEEILNRGPVYDFHNYTRISVDGRWINVDATFDKSLSRYGFVVNENWNGKTDTMLCVAGTYKVWDCGDKGLEEKRRMTTLLPEKIQRSREVFLRKMTEWIAELRVKGEI
ncbi:unnamed protein product [marine sediment metagenome]|uniref:Transglutaminase-like domain-containing protein n=1 Tax=marine sediment metagenome TaxID=412755 RepID=X0WLW7_9ZZZZ